MIRFIAHRTFTSHQLAQLRLNLEEKHAVELRDLRSLINTCFVSPFNLKNRLSYEAEKESLGKELSMVADVIRREVNNLPDEVSNKFMAILLLISILDSQT
jgi:hypothetical protein